jgi:ATP-binding cassette subfamily B protein
MDLKKLTQGLPQKYVLFSVLTPLVMIGEVLMETFIPLIMSRIIDKGIAALDTSYVIRTGLLMVCCTLLSLTFGLAGGRFSSVAAYGFSKNLRSVLFRKVQDFSFSDSDYFGTGSLVTRLTTDVTNLQNMYQNVIRSMIRSPLMLIFGTLMACFINLKLAVIFFVSIPVLAFFLAFIAVKAYPRFKAMFIKYDQLNTVVQENLSAIRVVKAFVRGEYEEEKFNKTAAVMRDAQIKAEKIVVFNAPLMKFVIYMCIISALWFGGNMVLQSKMTPGELISFLTYVTQILMSLMMLSMIFVQFILSRASVARVMEVLERPSGEQNLTQNSSKVSADTHSIEPEDYSVEFKNVFFSYDGTLQNAVLSNINIKIPSGSTAGIIGGIGSSKSTLVSLIPRLYEVSQGQVKLGGVDVSEYPYKKLRQLTGIVLQKNVLFSGTIEENIRWGRPDASMQEIEEVCKYAQAHDFIMSLPDGYQTVLGQGGVNLSGGQKQRLCLARALIKKPGVLILDDAASALDTATAAKIRTALRENFKDTTKIIISQRISSVQDADLIIVMDDGKISGQGTHSTLLSENKIYKEVYDSQLRESEET